MIKYQSIFLLLMFFGFSIEDRQEMNCMITEEELIDITSSIKEMYQGETPKFRKNINCKSLIELAETYTNEFKTFVASEIVKTDRIYNKTLEELIEKEKELIEELENMPRPLIEEYQKDIAALGAKIEKLHNLIDNLNLERERYIQDIEYYDDIINNGSKYASRFDLDSFFESAKKCSFNRGVINSLIREFNEIFEMTLGKPRNSQSECFDELRFQVSSIDNAVQHRLNHTKKIDSLKSTYEERSRSYKKLIDDYGLQIEQETKKNISAASDEFQRLYLEYKTLSNETKESEKESKIARFKAIKMMIRSGNKMRKSKELFMKIRKSMTNPFQEILKRTYECNGDYLLHVMVFAQVYDKKPGYEIIANEMRNCNQMDSPYLLLVANVVRNESLNEFVDKIYENFVGHIEQKSYDKIKAVMFRTPDVIDFNKLFKLALKEIPLKSCLDFIDSLHAYSQNIIVQLYDNVISLGYRGKYEHFQIATWISDRLNWINRQASNDAITGDLKPYLLELKERMPKSMRNFIFEPYVIFSTQDHEYLMRSDTHNGVKYKVQKHKTGKFYRFEEERYKKNFYSEEYKDANGNSEMRVRVGNQFEDKDYWEIIPTENEEFFHLKNKKTGYFLSSDEDEVCTKKEKKGWFTKEKCVNFEYMNKAYPDSSSPSTRWMFTEKLIRNGILPDRFRSI